MSVIIRLQHLPLTANSMDIRQFFRGLEIPDGGVHIVGGAAGDAFIAFSTDEDARQAMERSGTNLKDSQVKLLLSSRNEMFKVIEQARQQTLGLIPQQPGGGAQAQTQQQQSTNNILSGVTGTSGHPGHGQQPGTLPGTNSTPSSGPNPHQQQQQHSQAHHGGPLFGSMHQSSNNPNLSTSQGQQQSSLIGMGFPQGINLGLPPQFASAMSQSGGPTSGGTFPGSLGMTNLTSMPPPSIFSQQPPGLAPPTPQIQQQQRAHNPSPNPFMMPPPGMGSQQIQLQSQLHLASSSNPPNNNYGSLMNGMSGGTGGHQSTGQGMGGLGLHGQMMGQGGQGGIGPNSNISSSQIPGNNIPNPFLSNSSSGLNIGGGGPGPRPGLLNPPSFPSQGGGGWSTAGQLSQGSSNHPGGPGLNHGHGLGNGPTSTNSLRAPGPGPFSFGPRPRNPNPASALGLGPSGGGGPPSTFGMRHKLSDGPRREPPGGHPRGGAHPGGRGMCRDRGTSRDLSSSGRERLSRFEPLRENGRGSRPDSGRKSRSRSRERPSTRRRRSKSRSTERPRERDRDARPGLDRTRRRLDDTSRKGTKSRSRSRERRSSSGRGGNRDSGSGRRGSGESKDKTSSSPEKGRNSHGRRERNSSEPELMIVSDSHSSEEHSCAILSGIAKEVASREIADFLGIELRGGASGMIRNYDEGVAYLRLQKSIDYPKVSRLAGRKLGGSVVNVEPLPIEKWDEEKIKRREREKNEKSRDRDTRDRGRGDRDTDRRSDDRERGSRSSQDGCLMISGLSPAFTGKDVDQRILSANGISKESYSDIQLVASKNETGRSISIAYIIFTSKAEAEQALEVVHATDSNLILKVVEPEVMRRACRHVGIVNPSRGRSRERDRDREVPHEESNAKSLFDLEFTEMATESTRVLLRGVPHNMTTNEVIDFFSDIGVIPTNVRPVIDSSNVIRNDQLICEFNDSNKARRATTKDGMSFGRTIINISLMAQGSSGFDGRGSVGPAKQGLLGNRPPNPVNMGGSRFGAGVENPFLTPQMPFYPQMEAGSGGGGGGFRGGGRGRGFFRGRGRGGGPRMSRFDHQGPSVPEENGQGGGGELPAYLDYFDRPGCVLEISNIPFSADMDDFAGFLQEKLGCSVPTERIIRRHNEFNQLMGEARVGFENVLEAEAACARLQNVSLRKRPLAVAIYDGPTKRQA